MVVGAALVALGLSAMSLDVVVDDPTGCVGLDDLRRDLEAIAPPDVEVTGLEVVVNVSAAGAERREILLRMSERDATSPLLERSLGIGRDECEVVGRALARMVQRRLDKLPVERWQRRATPTAPPTSPEPPAPAPAPVAPAPVSADETAPPPSPRWPIRARPQLGLAAGGGVWPPLGDLRLELGASVGWGPLPDFVVSVRSSLAYPVPLGDGFAQVLSADLAAGVAYEIALPWVTLAPRAMLAAGAFYAWGFRFNRPRSAVLPRGAAIAALAAHSEFGPFVELGVEVPLTALQLETDGGGDTFYAPWLWGFARVGFSWGFEI